MIIKYKEFLNESINESEEYLQLRVKLLEVLLGDYDYAHDNHQTIDTISFSRLANTDRYDPDADYIDTLEVIKNETGITNDKMLVLFSDRINILLNQTFFAFIEQHDLHNQNADSDLYIYKTCELLGLDKNHFTLGGNEWAFWIFENGSEAIIRYNYGYHKTKYGKLLLEQLKLSDAKFKHLAECGIEHDLIEGYDMDWRSFLYIFTDYVKESAKLNSDIFNNVILLKDYVIFDENSIMFLTDAISKKLSDYGPIGDNLSNKKINSILENRYKNFDIQETNNEFIIYIGLD